MNEESVFRATWRLVTLPVRLVLLGLLWVFAPDGSPFRLIPLVGGLFLLAQVMRNVPAS